MAKRTKPAAKRRAPAAKFPKVGAGEFGTEHTERGAGDDRAFAQRGLVGARIGPHTREYHAPHDLERSLPAVVGSGRDYAPPLDAEGAHRSLAERDFVLASRETTVHEGGQDGPVPRVDAKGGHRAAAQTHIADDYRRPCPNGG